MSKNKIVPYSPSVSDMLRFSEWASSVGHAIYQARDFNSPPSHNEILDKLSDLLDCLREEFIARSNLQAMDALTALGTICVAMSTENADTASQLVRNFLYNYHYDFCQPSMTWTANAVTPLVRDEATIDVTHVIPENFGGCLGNCGFSFFGGGSF